MKPVAVRSNAGVGGRNTPDWSDAVIERGAQGSTLRVSNLEVNRATQ